MPAPRYDYYSRQPNAKLDEQQARFIIAECVLALEYIHRCVRVRVRAAALADPPAAARGMCIVTSSRKTCSSPLTATARWYAPCFRVNARVIEENLMVTHGPRLILAFRRRMRTAS